MVRNSVTAGRRGLGSLLGACGLGVVVVAAAAACASSSKAAGAGSASSVPVVASSSAGSGSAAPGTAASSGIAVPRSGAASSLPSAGGAGSGASTQPVNPGGGMVVTPQAQLQAAPAGQKLTPFDSAAHSMDGRTLYLGLDSQGGACGQYDVVLQQSSGKVAVGLVHLSSGTRMCPMYVTHMLVSAKLSAPLDGRSVVDLANGQVVPAPELG